MHTPVKTHFTSSLRAPILLAPPPPILLAPPPLYYSPPHPYTTRPPAPILLAPPPLYYSPPHPYTTRLPPPQGAMVDPTLMHYSFAFCASHVHGNRPDGIGTVTSMERELFDEVKLRLHILLENQISHFRLRPERRNLGFRPSI